MMVRLGTLAAAALAATLIALPAAAQEQSQRDRVENFARQGMERLMQALDLLFESIPQYELPVIEENGDIVIRRKRDSEPANEDEPEIDSTDT